MTSYFARYHRLRDHTLQAYERFNSSRRDRLLFYGYYLRDIVPRGVTVHYIPAGVHLNSREEVELRTLRGNVFLSGLITLEISSNSLEGVAVDEAFTKFMEGDFVRDDERWRFFTGASQLKFFKCNGNEDWELAESTYPIRDDAKYAAEYLQLQYSSLLYW